MAKVFKESTSLKEVFDDVKIFHEAFDHPVAITPTMLTQERKDNRIKWMQEELNEYTSSENLISESDALIDLIYFAIGTFVEMGIEPSFIWYAVQNANMKKLFPDGKPHFNENNKVIKPEGWKGPEEAIEAYIRKLTGIDDLDMSEIYALCI